MEETDEGAAPFLTVDWNGENGLRPCRPWVDMDNSLSWAALG
jgi:hypothetical protein